MADEALASFQSLLDSVPIWISELDNILTTATAQQSALTAEYEAHTAQERSSHTTFDFLRLAQRKRKTASLCSRTGSRPSDRRSRQCLAVIHYDGSVQKKFESLVRGIGSSRNCIRKAKLGLNIDSFASRIDSQSICFSSEGEETLKGLGTFTYRSTTTVHCSEFEETKAFDTVDSALEKAQLCCEKAAHRILREGDCSADIAEARRQFDSALFTVNAALPQLTVRAQECLRLRADEDAYASDAGSHSTHNVDGFSLPSDDVLAVDDDEVDDSDSEDFNIMTMKLPPHLSKYSSAVRQPQTRILAAA